MAQQSIESNKKNRNDSNTSIDRSLEEENKAQDTQVNRKRSKKGKKINSKHKNTTQNLPSGSGTSSNRACSYSSSAPMLRPTSYTSTMTTYYPQNYNPPITVTWNPLVGAMHVPPPPIYMHPIPVVVSPILTPVCPYSPYPCAVLSTPMVRPIIAQPVVTEVPAVTYYEPTTSNIVEHIETSSLNDDSEQQNEGATANVVEIVELPPQPTEDMQSQQTDSNATAEVEAEVTEKKPKVDPLDIYFSLPREYFRSPRTLTIDPNPIIDELCKLKDVHSHEMWLLDLEFGVHKYPVSRPIPIYDVNFNSINCKNAPNAIHPGFESCHDEFKSVMLFYYDCMISSLYTSYVMLNSDTSVDNFQSWLIFPMLRLGMCWL